jgi:hypothetical protein
MLMTEEKKLPYTHTCTDRKKEEEEEEEEERVMC